LYLAYLILKYIYGKDYKKWEPILYKDVTLRSIFFSKRGGSKIFRKDEPKTIENKE
jgi:hypothetical protein